MTSMCMARASGGRRADPGANRRATGRCSRDLRTITPRVRPAHRGRPARRRDGGRRVGQVDRRRARGRPRSTCRSSTATTSTTRASIERMRAGIPLDDAARGPWLDRLHAASGRPPRHRRGPGVLGAHRGVPRPPRPAASTCRFVLLDVPPAVLADRLRRPRTVTSPGADLLASQLATLERGPDVVAVDADRPPADVAARRRGGGRGAAHLGSGRRATATRDERREATAWSWCWWCSPSSCSRAAAGARLRLGPAQHAADHRRRRRVPQLPAGDAGRAARAGARASRTPRRSATSPACGPATAVLVLTDGSRLPVRSLSDPDAGVGVDALNARVAALRRD